jgi:SAM-dependent MidA family methyltransferase
VRRQEWQRKTLEAFSSHVHWASNLDELRDSLKSSRGVTGVRGIIFGNELLDAMPVRRFGWDARRRRWFEWGVTLDGERFVWIRLPPLGATEQVAALNEQVKGLVEFLPNGFTVEICPQAKEWWRRAAELLVEGKLLAIDYGFSEEELFRPERTEGTLRGYHRHRWSPDFLADPGEQDITAHVNFGAIQAVGEAAGLRTDAFISQAQFLTSLVGSFVSLPRMNRDLDPSPWPFPLRRGEAELSAAAAEKSDDVGATGSMGSRISEWTPARIRQFQTLTHPGHLGRAFRVLVQSRALKVNS